MRIRTTYALAVGSALAAALSAAPAAAQNTITAGQTVSGRLTESDPKLDDDSHYQVWNYRAHAGEHLTITLRSSDFDAYLAFGQMENGECTGDCDTDDDGAGGTDSKVETDITRDGVYGIRVNTLSSGETGAYTLAVTSGAAQPKVAPTARGTIGVGQTVEGTLSASDPKADDDSYYQLWNFRGTPGQTIVITLRSSDFDSYLAWGRMEGGEFTEIDSDDDGAGGNDARLEVTVGSEGSYAIRANTLAAGETGRYTLSVEAGSGKK